ncbi:MAG: hypothetical protein ACYTFH_00800 [Planctomycetota bacterium]
MQPLLERLWSIARRSRAALVTSRTGTLLALAVLAVMFAIALDAVFRWPAALRWLVLGAMFAGAVLAWRRRLRPALAFRPTPIDIALRLEHEHATLRGRLASAVDLHLAGTDRVDPFAASAVASVTASIDASTLRLPIRTEPVRRALLAGIGTLALAGLAIALLPGPSRIGLERTFMPWTDAAWPARTDVESLMGDLSVVARGRPFSLAASLERGDPSRERVRARYRLERDGASGAWEEVVMTRQSGRRFERRVPSDADAIEFLFESVDDATGPQRIEFTTPPEVRSASLLVEPPDYAAAVRGPQRFELGPGTDRRSEVPAPQLAGSTATLRLELAKPLPVPDPGTIGKTLVGAPGDAEFSIDPSDPGVWNLVWRLDRPVAIECRLRDEHGLESTAGATYRVGVAVDAAPTVAIVVPESDDAVLPTAVLAIEAQARDDLEVTAGGLEASVGDGETVSIAEDLGMPGDRRTIRATLSIESLGAEAGDVVEVIATATDGLPGRASVRSSPRRLSIVGAEEFTRRIREEFSALRRLAIRADGEQSELLEAIERAEGGTPDGAAAAALRARQAGVSRRLERISEGVEELSARLERNRLDDDRQRELAEEVERRAGAAGLASIDAERAWRQAAESDAAGASIPSEEAAGSESSNGAKGAARAEARGREVRRELEGLVAALDRDEDTWALERELERLAEGLESLAEDAEAFGRETVGRTPEEMAEAERRTHEDLVRRQEEIDAAAERVLSELDERSRRLEDRDLGQSEALRRAADSGRQAGLEQSLDEAGEALERNRTDQAAEAQRRASEALQRMGRQLEDTRKVRTETLRRLMTELAESIEALLAQSEEEALALRGMLADADPWAAPDVSVRAERAIRLERNTRSVAGAAAAGGADSEMVAAALDRAATAQGEAITALRDRPPRGPDASASMERSSGLLREALELARRIGEDAERDAQREQRRELAADYRALASLQETVAEETSDLSDRLDRGEISQRRRLLETRRQSNRQNEVAEAATGIAEGVEEIAETAVFAGGHEWIDRWSVEASDSLLRGEAGVEVGLRQRRIATTARAMAEAVEALAEDDERFAGGERGSAGGGGSGSGAGGGDDGAIPPISELRLLRSLQEAVYLGTRALEESRGPDAPDSSVRTAELEQLAEMQRSILEFGNRLLEALEERPTEEIPEIEASGPAPLGFGAEIRPRDLHGDHGDDETSGSSAPDPPPTSPPSPPPSLDDLLGIEGETSDDADDPDDADGPDDPDAEVSTALEDRLRERPIADGFKEALAGMVESEQALAERGDTGLSTQRVQEAVLRNLQALIDNARRERQQQQQSSSSSSSSSSDPSQSPSGSRSSQPSGQQGGDPSDESGESGEASPPAFEQAELGGILEEGRVEWGRLPERVRELVRQGRRDRISSIYRRLTEQYYRRLAEEAVP